MKGNNGISKIIKDGGAGWNLCGVLGGRKWNGEGFSFCADNSIYWSD